MARIGIDLDGVCYDFQGALREFMTEIWGFKDEDLPEATDWNFYRNWGNPPITDSDFHWYVTQATVHGGLFDYADPINNADNVIRKLKNHGHSIHIITDRDWGQLGEAQRQTVSWLKTHSIPFDSLHFTAEKGMVDVEYMLDDKPQNVRDMLANGTEAALLDRPWNQGPELPRVTSVALWGECILLNWLTEEEAV